MLCRLHRNESGVAMVTAMLVSMVVLSLSLISVQLAVHNSEQSSRDRKRLQAVHAAEAGLDAYLALLPRTALGNIQCTPGPATLPVDSGAQYQVTAVYYPTFPGIPGQEMSCPLNPNVAPPGGAVITSRGTAVAVANARSVSRTMQTQVRLNPVLGSFGQAIFSDTVFNVVNNLTVNGNNGNDADLYTNGNFTCSNSSVDYGSILAQGSATLSNSCTVLQDLRVNGSITMLNSARVGHDAISSTGSITMEGPSVIANNARAATTCSGCTGRVIGTITTSSPSAAPPRINFPTVNWVPSAWTDAGYQIRTENNCSSAKNFIETLNGTPTNYVVRISPGCSLSLAGVDITLGGNLAIISDGSISTSNRTVFKTPDGATAKEVFFIVPRNLFTPATPPDSRADNCSSKSPVPNISLANNTDFINVRTFIYTPCTVNLNNNNIGLGGQIFGQTVNINNHFSFSFRPMLIPGAGVILGFNSDIAYLREITND
ncbi:MAG: hypothetical protein WD770_03470 [Actinomycetota bacterium]